MWTKLIPVFFAVAMLAHASDPMAVYARVDKVVLPSAPESSDTIEIWGVFCLAKPGDRNYYLPAVRGYLYFKLSTNKEAARKEWADFKELAGSGQIVAFGSRFESQPRLRKADERPENPDPFSTNFGLVKVQDRSDWQPVKALKEFKD